MSENEKLDLILSEMKGVKSDVCELKDEMQSMKGEIQDVKDRTQAIEQKVTGVHLILENEIRVNIQRVAEGHLDLSRNLHDAMKPSNEIEMLAIKVRMLESDMREVKAKIS